MSHTSLVRRIRGDQTPCVAHTLNNCVPSVFIFLFHGRESGGLEMHAGSTQVGSFELRVPIISVAGRFLKKQRYASLWINSVVFPRGTHLTQHNGRSAQEHGSNMTIMELGHQRSMMAVLCSTLYLDLNLFPRWRKCYELFKHEG